MKFYSGEEYLLINLANAYGKDKLTFEDRIAWAKTYILPSKDITAMAHVAETPPAFLKACLAWQEYQMTGGTHALMGLDATCSGPQLMSVMTGCVEGAKNTGTVDTGTRPDLYQMVTNQTNHYLRLLGETDVQIPRERAKKATVAAFYGSVKAPRDLFGEGNALKAFHAGMKAAAPGPYLLLHHLIEAWDAKALTQTWTMPDNFKVRIRSTVKKTARLEVDELDHSSFTFCWDSHGPQEGSVSTAANAVHSVDAFVLREMYRRLQTTKYLEVCSEMADHKAKPMPMSLAKIYELLEWELEQRILGFKGPGVTVGNSELAALLKSYRNHRMPTFQVLPYLRTQYDIEVLPNALVQQLHRVLQYSMRGDVPLMTVHDEFHSSPSFMNRVRWHYTEILAQLCEARVIETILYELYLRKATVFPTALEYKADDPLHPHSNPWGFPKALTATMIRESNYALS